MAVADAHEEGARKALLERLAGDLNVLANSPHMHWACCWLFYTGPRGEPWEWQMCGRQSPGHLPMGTDGRYVNCGHWHHRWEIFMA